MGNKGYNPKLPVAETPAIHIVVEHLGTGDTTARRVRDYILC